MKPTIILLCATLASTGFAQESSSPDQAINSFNRAFEAAYAKADLPVLGAMFSDDAEYTSEEGDVYIGKAEIEKALGGVFSDRPGSTLTIKSDKIRPIAAGVILENGVSTGVDKSGESNSAQFTALYVQKEGKWKISSLVESPMPALTPADHLSELDWLLGKWEETDPNNAVTVASDYTQARGDNYLTRNITVKRDGNGEMEGWQIIGWDAVRQCLRSWTFDSEGGFSDGLWTRSGNQWLVREIGFAPDGSRNSSDITISKVDQNRFTWESNNRTLNGEPQPAIDRLEIKRVKGN